MSQSTLTVGVLAAGFLLFLAARGRLSAYTNVLWGPAPKPQQGSSSGSASGGSSGGSGSFLDTLANLGEHAIILAAEGG